MSGENRRKSKVSYKSSVSQSEICQPAAIYLTVGVTKQNHSLSLRDAVILNGLQIGHTRATHAHLFGHDEAFCATCYTSLTVNHILMECPQFNHHRQQYHFGSTLKELFNTTSVNDIIAFIKDTHFYTRI